MRISSLEQQVDISAHYQVTAAFNELAGDYRDLWGEERAKGLNLEAQIELMASKNMVQAAATRLETHTTVSTSPAESRRIGFNISRTWRAGPSGFPSLS